MESENSTNSDVLEPIISPEVGFIEENESSESDHHSTSSKHGESDETTIQLLKRKLASKTKVISALKNRVQKLQRNSEVLTTLNVNWQEQSQEKLKTWQVS